MKKINLRNPILISEMKVRMRTKRTYVTLFVYLAFVSALLILFFAISDVNNNSYYSNDLTGYGTTFFTIFVILQFFIISWGMPGTAAGVISSEKEKQTFDLLLCTQMSPLKIIIGKLLSSVSMGILLILMFLPLYGITFIYGGVEITDVLICMLFLILLAFFGSSVGVLISAIMKKSTSATVTTYIVVILFNVLTLVLVILEAYIYEEYFGGMSHLPIGFYINPLMSQIYIIMLVLYNNPLMLGGFLTVPGVTAIDVYIMIAVNIVLMLLVTIAAIIISSKIIDPIKAKASAERRRLKRKREAI